MSDYFPYILVDFVGNETVVEGTKSHFIGYNLPLSDGHNDGIFAQWFYESGCLRAQVDWLGIQPLFYGVCGSKVVVSNNVLRIIEKGIRPDLDYGAVADFLRLGFLLDCDTVFRHIRAFPPGGTLVWKAGKLEVSGEYPEASLKRSSLAEEESAYIELFRQSIVRRVESSQSFIQPVSGGRDSRHIIAELVRQGVRPELTYTVKTSYQDTPTGEEQTAAAVAQALGLRHKVVDHGIRSEIVREACKNVLTNFSCDEGAWMLGAFQVLHENKGAIYDGFLGDVLSAFHWVNCGGGILQAHHGGDASAVIDAIYSRMGGGSKCVEDYISRLFSDKEEALSCQTKNRMLKLFRKFEATHNPITRFFIFSRGRREIAMSTYGNYPFLDKIYAPFLDRDFFTYFLSLEEREEPSYAFARSNALAKAYPQLATIPFAKTVPQGKAALFLRRLSLFKDAYFGNHQLLVGPSGDLREWTVNKFLQRPGSLDLGRAVLMQQLSALTSPDRAAELMDALVTSLKLGSK